MRFISARRGDDFVCLPTCAEQHNAELADGCKMLLIGYARLCRRSTKFVEDIVRIRLGKIDSILTLLVYCT